MRIIRKVKRRIVTFEIIHEVQGVLPFPDPALRLGRAHHALDIHQAAHVQAEIAPVQLHLEVGQTLFGNPFRQGLRQAVLHPRAAPRGIQRIGGAKSTYPCLLRREAIMAIIALMKEIAARDAKNRFGRLLDTVQSAPVRVTKKGRAVGVMMSIQQYERLRGAAWERLTMTIDALGKEASANGLTDAGLEALLADES